MDGQDPFERLPNELIAHITGYLSRSHVVALASTNLTVCTRVLPLIYLRDLQGPVHSLQWACWHGSHATVRAALLIYAGTGKDVKDLVDSTLDFRSVAALLRHLHSYRQRPQLAPHGSLLHIAALRGQTAIMKLLLEAGARPDVEDMAGNTPLHYAINAAVVRILVDAGANVEARNDGQATPLCQLAEHGSAIESGNATGIHSGSDTAQQRRGGTIAPTDQTIDFPGAMRCLVTHGGADPSPPTARLGWFNYPLSYAVCADAVDVAATLLRLGTSPNVPERDPGEADEAGCGPQPLLTTLAALLASPGMMGVLLDAGACVVPEEGGQPSPLGIVSRHWSCYGSVQADMIRRIEDRMKEGQGSG